MRSDEWKAMIKDTRLTFRVQSGLKKELEAISKAEGRSVAQICEVFLRAGAESYWKEGPKLLKRFVSRTEGS